VFGAEVAVKRVMRGGTDVAVAGNEPWARRSMCHVIALSRDGVRLRSYDELPAGAIIALSLPFGIKRRARIVTARGYQAICRFHEPLPEHSLNELIARYDFLPSENEELLGADAPTH
jgi:hypothetical protein